MTVRVAAPAKVAWVDEQLADQNTLRQIGAARGRPVARLKRTVHNRRFLLLYAEGAAP